MSLLDGLLSGARAAIPGAVAARAGYLHGQDLADDKRRAEARQDAADKRQSLLDRIAASRQESETNESNARADSLRNPSDEQPIFDQDGGAWSYSKRSGSLHRIPIEGADDQAGKPPAASGGSLLDKIPVKAPAKAPASTTQQEPSMQPPAARPKFGTRAPATRPATLRQPNTVNLLTKNIEDVYSDGSRKVIRKATAEELEKAGHVPGGEGGSGGNPTDKKRLVLQTRVGNLQKQIDQNAKDLENANLADDFDTPAAKQRMAQMRTRGDSLRKVSDGVNAEIEQLSRDTPGPAHKPAPHLTLGATGDSPVGRQAISQDQYDFLTTPVAQGGKGLTKAQVDAKYTVKK